MAINCLGKTKQWSEALSVYGRMRTELGIKPDGMTHSIIINTLAMVSDVLASASFGVCCVFLFVSWIPGNIINTLAMVSVSCVCMCVLCFCLTQVPVSFHVLFTL